MTIQILQSYGTTKVKKGFFYSASPYPVDPGSKVIVHKRVSKATGRPFGKELNCTEYRSNIKVINNK